MSDYKDQEINLFTSNAFFEYKEGLYGLSAKKIPKALAIALEKMMGINQIYAIGITTGDEIFGLVTLLRKSKGEFRTKRIIETIVNQASVVLKRQHVEEEIRKINDELERRVTERTANLEEANKELEAFSYSVSHDLRAPLRHINGYVELLSECFHDSLPKKEKHYLDSIADSAHHMGILVDDLLEFSRTGRQEMQQTRVEMNDVIQEALKIVDQDTTGRRIKWVIGRLPFVFGDHNLLQLVWINLLSNAVKFTRGKEKAMIEVGFREDKNEYLFYVRDNGVGFDMQYAHKLFGVFHRLHSSAEYKGTGIGLANVRRIILKHGGRTWAEAKLEKGATFYFSIPKLAPGTRH
jgi:light-regulated signal transduction histidine kinase (bacteriophytochrome)